MTGTANVGAVGVHTPAAPAPARYQQVADDLARRILAGHLPAASVMPSEKTMATSFGVARGTIRQAVGVLRERGLVVTEPGRGTVVQPTPGMGWCGDTPCPADGYDGSRYHMSPPVVVATTSGDGVLDVSVSRLDYEDGTSSETTVDLSIGDERTVSLTPEQVTALIDVLRDHVRLSACPAHTPTSTIHGS